MRNSPSMALVGPTPCRPRGRRARRPRRRFLAFAAAAAALGAGVAARVFVACQQPSPGGSPDCRAARAAARPMKPTELRASEASEVPASTGSDGSASSISAEADLKNTTVAAAAGGKAAGNWFEETKEFWDSLEFFLPLEEDDAEEAKALLEQQMKVDQLVEEQEKLLAKKSYMRGKANEFLGEELSTLQSLVFAYWTMRVTRVLGKESVRRGFVSLLTYGNILFIAVFLRTVVPRLLVVSSLDDFFGLANDLGVPSKANLLAAIETLQGYDLLVRIGAFALAFIVEKVTLISEILPIQIGLKTLAPVVFGGLIPGALISASCETIGAIVNFLVGRVFFTEKVRGFSFFGAAPLGEAPWFRRLEKAAEKDGLQLTLLLRLSHILPLPFDSYWYILGALPVRFVDFVGAHWVGCLKTAFLDAGLGLLLLTSAGMSLDGPEKQEIVIAETVGFTAVAFLVQTYATGLAKEVLDLQDEKESGGSSSSSGSEPGDQATAKA